MDKILTVAAVAALVAILVGFSHGVTQDPPAPPQPAAQHAWLKQLAGDWTVDGEITMDPAQPAIQVRGTERGRMIGGFWVQVEHQGEFMGAPFTGTMTLGYSAAAGKYVGTWVDSMNDHLWIYEGTVDASGKVLTLTSEGPCPEEAGRRVKFRETLELKDAGHKVFSSYREKDGAWVKGMSLHSRRKS